MLNQRLFEGFGEDSPPPTPKAPSTAHLAQQYIETGRTADGVAGRRARAAVNRVRVKTTDRGLTSTTNGHERDTRNYGLEQAPGHWESKWLPQTFSEHEWRKFGHVEEVPYTQLRAAQTSVVDERVKELQRRPGMGVDPRYSGSMRELPHAVKSYDDEYELHQGHHRVIADMTREQPQLFHQARVVNAPRTVGEQQLATADVHDYRKQRAERMGVDYDAIASRL